MINEQIRDKEVRVLGENGELVGIMSPKDALKIAKEQGVDLVKFVPNANPPVCPFQRICTETPFRLP